MKVIDMATKMPKDSLRRLQLNRELQIRKYSRALKSAEVKDLSEVCKHDHKEPGLHTVKIEASRFLIRDIKEYHDINKKYRKEMPWEQRQTLIKRQNELASLIAGSICSTLDD